jgi:preprotein translocase subunit SecA
VQVAEPEIVEAPAQAPAIPAPAPVTPAPAGSALSQLDGQAQDGAAAVGSPALSNGGLAQPQPQPQALTYTGPAQDGGTQVRGRGDRGRHAGTDTGGPARNAPCPCGSGKKYKRCHGAPNAAHS